jgi:transposase-like protein
MAQARERAVWERIVAEVEAGMSHSAAAQRYGVSASGVGHWVRRLREEKARRPTSQLLPVRLTSPSPSRARCLLVVDDLHLTFDEGTDPGYIAALARAIRAC